MCIIICRHYLSVYTMYSTGASDYFSLLFWIACYGFPMIIFSNMKLSYDSDFFCISFECHPPAIVIVTMSHWSVKQLSCFSRYNWVTYSLAASVGSCSSHTTPLCMKGPFLDKTIRLKWHKQPIWFFPLSASVSLPLEALVLPISLSFCPTLFRN